MTSSQETSGSRPSVPTEFGDTQKDAPYSDQVQALVSQKWQRLHVPAHQGRAVNSPGVARVIGERALELDLPMLFSQIDQSNWVMGASKATPLNRSLALAAQAWGAERAWFLTNGASMGNHIASLAARTLGTKIIVQRSMHSSAIHGLILAGLEPEFVTPHVDNDLGSAHGVTSQQIQDALIEHPDAGAVYIVTPSYFGAVADVGAIAEVCHRQGVPLIVDEAWGAHLGFHDSLPLNAIRAGADLVISSSHKFIGSLFQSAMLLLGRGAQAARLSTAVDRVYQSVQSTSSSALLMLSLDEARRDMALEGSSIERTLEQAASIREQITSRGRFRDAGPQMLTSPDVHALDPFKIVIDTRPGGISGTDAHYQLMRDHKVYLEMATPSVVVALLGARSDVDVQRFLDALHSLPASGPDDGVVSTKLPAAGARRVGLREAYFSNVEVVAAGVAAGRVSADALAAYPPGIPNVVPGEELTPELIQFLRATAASDTGYVRGAVDPALDVFRVLTGD